MTSSQKSVRLPWIGVLTGIAVLAPVVLIVYSLRIGPTVVAALGAVTAFITTGRLLMRQRRDASAGGVGWPSPVRLMAGVVAGLVWAVLLRVTGEEGYWGFAGNAVSTAAFFWIITTPWPMRKGHS